MSPSAAAAPMPAKAAPIAVDLATSPSHGPQSWVERPTSTERWWLMAPTGSWTAARAHRERRAGPRRHEHRPAEGPAQARRRAAHEPHEQRRLDRRARGEQHELAVTVVACALQLGGREVRSRVDRHGRDDAVTWPQQQDRGLRDNEGSNHGHGNPAGAFHVRKECPTAKPAARFMQVAIVSDIHGNRHAFEAVLADVRNSPAQEIWCLGDVVGYGADPNDCCRLARKHADVCLAGNHDLAVTGDLDLGEFSTGAALAARWTQEVIDAGHRDWLTSLKPAGSVRGVGLYHASPRDPVWEYVLSALLAELCLDAQPERLSLVGHSHVALSFVRPEGQPATGSARKGGEEVDVAEGEWILNPGSVGQPRDGDARAAWLLLDTSAWIARWRRTEYDIAGAAAAIRAARLPDSLAERLEYGQ